MGVNENFVLAVFGALFIFSIFMISQTKITGYATTGTTISNVSIAKYLSITMSPNLTAGIQFGTINILPAVDHNATGNNLSAGNSVYSLNVSADSNTPVDFCLMANVALTDSSNENTIGLGNETYANASTTSAAVPDVTLQALFTTGYVVGGANVAPGDVTFYRFYLDVPVAQPSGTYNNSIGFKGVQTEQSC